MEPIVNKWFSIIENMSNSNTYKLAWGRGILEICQFQEYDLIDDKISISFEQIAKKMLKYYWNQTYYFNLLQGPLNSEPVFLKLVKELIQEYQEKTNSSLPVWFTKAEQEIMNEYGLWDHMKSKLVRVLKQDVSWRFPIT